MLWYSHWVWGRLRSTEAVGALLSIVSCCMQPMGGKPQLTYERETLEARTILKPNEFQQFELVERTVVSHNVGM